MADTRTALKAEKDANINTNAANAITGSIHNTFLENLLDSVLVTATDPHVGKVAELVGVNGSTLIVFTDNTGTSHWSLVIAAGTGTPTWTTIGVASDIDGKIDTKGIGDLEMMLTGGNVGIGIAPGAGVKLDALGNFNWGITEQRIRGATGGLRTTDATVTTILSIALGANASFTMTVNVVAHDDSPVQRFSQIEHLAIDCTAGTTTISNQATALTYNPATSLGGLTFNVGTANTLLVQVEGLGGVNVAWRAYVSDIGGAFV